MGVLKWIVRAAVFAFIFSVWTLYLQPFTVPFLAAELKDEVLAHIVAYFAVFIVAWLIVAILGWRF
jgi:hypothetical protein